MFSLNNECVLSMKEKKYCADILLIKHMSNNKIKLIYNIIQCIRNSLYYH